MNKELLVEWIKTDAEFFVKQLEDAKAMERQKDNNMPVEFYYKGKVAALEMVLRVAYKNYLDMLAREEEENGKTL